MLLRWLASALAAILFTTGIGAVDASAQRAKLVRMADTEADLSTGSVTINTSRVPGSFGELRLYNGGSNILIDNVKVYYSDGSVHNENRTINLLRGERTRPIDAGRANKFVDKIVVTYKEVANSRRSAHLVVYGMQDRRAARQERPRSAIASPAKPRTLEAQPARVATPTAPAAPPAVEKIPIKYTKAVSETRCVGEGSLLLRRANVGFGDDRDRLKIGGQAGKFDKIRLCVFGHDIDLLDLKVTFAKGDPLELPYAGLIPAGNRTQAISLKGDRFIDTIDITYKKREGITAFANVEIWGEISEKWIDEESELFNDGWVRLTSGQTAGFVGFDTERTLCVRISAVSTRSASSPTIVTSRSTMSSCSSRMAARKRFPPTAPRSNPTSVLARSISPAVQRRSRTSKHAIALASSTRRPREPTARRSRSGPSADTS